MPVPSAPNSVSLLDIQNEFGGTNPIGINEYYGKATGIPGSGTISFSDFRGKSSGPITGTVWPTPVSTTYGGSMTMPYATSTTAYNWSEWLVGLSASNILRTGGRNINDLNTNINNAGRSHFYNCNNHIIQAKPGDTIRFTIRNWAVGQYNEVNSIHLNLGSGYFVLCSNNLKGPHIDSNIDYTISSTQSTGNYGIVAYNNWNTGDNWPFYVIGSSSWNSAGSANFYSFNIC